MLGGRKPLFIGEVTGTSINHLAKMNEYCNSGEVRWIVFGAVESSGPLRYPIKLRTRPVVESSFTALNILLSLSFPITS